MADRKTRTVSLPADEAEYVDSLVAFGAYPSASEVVEVVPVYDAMQRNPDRAISGDEITAAVEARHAERLKKRKGGA